MRRRVRVISAGQCHPSKFNNSRDSGKMGEGESRGTRLRARALEQLSQQAQEAGAEQAPRSPRGGRRERARPHVSAAQQLFCAPPGVLPHVNVNT